MDFLVVGKWLLYPRAVGGSPPPILPEIPQVRICWGSRGSQVAARPRARSFLCKDGKTEWGGDGGQLVQGHLPATVELTSVCRPWPE